MKILFLTRRFYPDIGGVEKHVLEISKELIRQGHKITIITESPPPPRHPPSLKLWRTGRRASNYQSRDQSDTYGINSKKAVKSSQIDNFDSEKFEIFRLNFGDNDWLKKFRIWLKLLGYISTIKDSDVVHCHDVFFWYLPFRFLFPSKKVFITFHGYETKYPPTKRAKLIRKISEKLSRGNICVGDFIKRWYGTKPNFVTYGGVEKTRNLKLKNRNLDIRGKRLNILLIGRLEEDNGAKIYLAALKELKKHRISYNLKICGEGEFRRQFQKYGTVKGFVDNLNKYIDRSDFIFTASYLSILKGISRGKNVFSVFQDKLKRDYLKLSPFRKYIYVASNSLDLVDQLLFVQSNPGGSYNKILHAQKWSRTQTWARVVDLYLKLWDL